MIISNFAALLVGLVGLVLVLALPIALIWVVFKLVAALCWLIWKGVTALATGIGYGFRGVGFGFGHVGSFLRNTVVDALRLVGALLTSVFVLPPILGSVFLGRWSAANHYGKALERELKEAGVRLYRVAIGNPVRLLGLHALTEGVEERLPEVMAKAPGADRPRGGVARFDGYTITGSLPRGGSGARLYLAEPSATKRDAFAKSGFVCPALVVIKAFSLEDGSTLPQIVRESRALTAAKELGLVLDHSLEGEDFWYVMPFVEGSDLAEVTREVHRLCGDEGLTASAMRDVLRTTTQLLATLDRFHTQGLWHKDIKPANIIVSPDGHAHLVDFGLVTPLRSAMTLTTHGTEYFRDPEMVRLAMQGVKVHEVDGVKFDIYSIGAVLYSMIENSFPAHGSLSHITKRCPESLRWIVRRAMADTKNRYSSSREMLADVVAVMEARDPFALEPADLPSFGAGATLASTIDPQEYASAPLAGPTFVPLPQQPLSEASPARGRRRIHKGVLAAVVLFATTLGLGLIATARGLAGADWDRQYARAHTDESEAAAIATASARTFGSDPLAEARSVAEELLGQVRGSRTSASRATCYRHADHTHHVRGCSGAHPIAGGNGPLPAVSSKRDEPFDVLIVNDLPPSASDESVLAQLVELLEQADMEPRGLASDDAREIEWLAEARKAAGVGFPLGPESVAHLEDFLESDDVLDAVWWLAPGKRDDELMYRFVVPNQPSADDVAVLALR
jgi:serine/threonine protein kinase